MKINKTLKITLDIIMTLLLILMYKKTVLGLKFHEVGGLALISLFVVHILFNLDWVKGVLKGAIKKRLAPRARLSLILNMLLMLSFILVGISGVLISKNVLLGISSSNKIFRTIHIGGGCFALIIIGIHVGLHWNSIKKKITILNRLPLLRRRILTVTFILSILIGGGVSLKQTTFIKNLKLPLSLVSNQQGGEKGSRPVHGEKPAKGPEEDNKLQGGPGGPHTEEISLSIVLKVVLQYLSILSIFTLGTYYIEKFVKHKNTDLKKIT